MKAALQKKVAARRWVRAVRRPFDWFPRVGFTGVATGQDRILAVTVLQEDQEGRTWSAIAITSPKTSKGRSPSETMENVRENHAHETVGRGSLSAMMRAGRAYALRWLKKQPGDTKCACAPIGSTVAKREPRCSCGHRVDLHANVSKRCSKCQCPGFNASPRNAAGRAMFETPYPPRPARKPKA